MKTKSTIKLFATAILATATIGTSVVHADAKITRDTENDSVEIVSDPYKTFDEADKALNNVKDKYLEEYGSYRAGVNPTEDLKNYEVYAIVRKVSLDETAESTVQNVAKALSHSQVEDSTTPTTPTTPTTDDKPEEIPATPVEPSAPVSPSENPTTPSTPSDTPATPTVPSSPSENPVAPTAPSVTPSETPAAPTVPTVPSAPSETPAAPVAPAAPSVDQTTPTTLTTPVEDHSKPVLQNSDIKTAQGIVSLSNDKKEDAKPSKTEDTDKSVATVKTDASEKEDAAKTSNSESAKKDEDKLKELPNTGESASNLGFVGLMILSVLAGFFGFKKRNS